MFRVGVGFDVHPFADGRPLVLGGVVIPHPRGLAGHSDADAVCHALCDALLGAFALGDIGKMFPDNDPAHKNANSLELLRQVAARVGKQGGRAVNVDVSVAAQSPKIAPYTDAMRANVADALGIAASCVGIKATTAEGLGFVGRQEGIAVYAVALMQTNEGGQ